ncbi:MAG: RNA polymerase subunit sigma [Candidatus Nephthysia bennettiae]|nr:MAG: RNA polymerase subunit sigma [Candidatus Dormibacteraeota bacterium]
MLRVAATTAETVGVSVGDQDSAGGDASDDPVEDLAFVYAFIYRRVGNREDAEDLTQEVALKALHRLRRDRPLAAVRAYLVATARSVMANFWTQRLGLPADELREEIGTRPAETPRSHEAEEEVERVLSLLPDHYRQLLELRFLRGYSTKDVANELSTTVGAVKVMQLRALRAAARLAAPPPSAPSLSDGRSGGR